jgi:hypothetical protein
VRLRVEWRPSGRWVTWGSTTVVSAGTAGIKGSRQYAASIGPVMFELIVPLSRRDRAEQERRLRTVLRRVASYRGRPRFRRRQSADLGP